MSAENHHLLLAQVASGNQKAFAELYELYKQKVYSSCLSYLQQTTEAEEVTQDVFVEVYQSAGKFNRKSSVNTWIYRICVNKCLDRLRYLNRKKRFAITQSLSATDDDRKQLEIPTFHHPGIILENKEKAAMLFAAIKRLPEQQQSAFILARVEGLPQKEVAEIMNTSVKAVESLLSRAKKQLKILLENVAKNEGFKK